MTYGIARQDGTVVCCSPLPYLGYALDTLKSMEKAGYLLLIDEKRVKFPTAAQLREARNA